MDYYKFIHHDRGNAFRDWKTAAIGIYKDMHGLMIATKELIDNIPAPTTPNAEDVPFTPPGGMSSTNVQDAIEEVYTVAAAGGTAYKYTDYVFSSSQNYTAGNYTINPASDSAFPGPMGYQNLASGNITYWGFRMYSVEAVSAGSVTVNIMKSSISAATGQGSVRAFGNGTLVDYLIFNFSGASALAYYKGNADTVTFGTIPNAGMLFADMVVAGGVTITGGITINVNTKLI